MSPVYYYCLHVMAHTVTQAGPSISMYCDIVKTQHTTTQGYPAWISIRGLGWAPNHRHAWTYRCELSAHVSFDTHIL